LTQLSILRLLRIQGWSVLGRRKINRWLVRVQERGVLRRGEGVEKKSVVGVLLQANL